MTETTNSTITATTAITATSVPVTDSKRLENPDPSVAAKNPDSKPTKKSATKSDGIKKVKAEIMPGQTSLIPKKTDVAIAAEKKRLEESTDYIRKEISAVATSFCRIGFKLYEIKDKELYNAQGFKNISEYGEKVLGFKKSSTANYIAICERFSELKNGKPTPRLASSFAAFGYSQLSVMLALPESKVEQVKPDMTVKEIRSLKDAESKKAPTTSVPEYDNHGHKIEYSDPPVVIFDRVLTEENLVILIKLLRENVGKEICVEIG